MKKYYIIAQFLEYADSPCPIPVLFGYTDSYEVVRWFGQNHNRFHSKIVVKQWDVENSKELLHRLNDEFAIEEYVDEDMYYLKMAGNYMRTSQRPVYINQSFDTSAHAYTLWYLLEDAIRGLLYQMLHMRIYSIDNGQIKNMIRCLQVLWRYYNDDCNENCMIHLDNISVLIDMIEYDDIDGDTNYYGY